MGESLGECTALAGPAPMEIVAQMIGGMEKLQTGFYGEPFLCAALLDTEDGKASACLWCGFPLSGA